MGTPNLKSLNFEPEQAALIHPFLLLRSVDALCQHLGVSKRRLSFLLYVLPAAQRYRSFELKKRKSKATRTIKNPVKPLKEIQQHLAKDLLDIYRAPLNVYGYVKDRDIVDKAERHVGQRWVARIDLENFFGSFNFGRVRGMFRAKPFYFPDALATVLAQLCVDSNELPQGAPTSPVISNILMWRLDARLRRMAREHRCVYTRYADDLVFSTNTRRMSSGICNVLNADSDAPIVRPGDALLKEIRDEGLAVNDSKTRLYGRTERQQVTGLTVNEKVNLDRDYVKQLRAVLYACSKVGVEAAAERFFASHYPKNVPPGKRVPQFADVIKGRVMYVGRIKGYSSGAFLALASRLKILVPDFRVPEMPVTPRVYIHTEGATDYLHLHAALKKLQSGGEFTDLSVGWDDHSKREQLGDKRLLQLCEDTANGPRQDRLNVFVFDRDIADTVTKAEREGEPRVRGNGVVSLCLPVPAHRPASSLMCIEHLYTDEFLYQQDTAGRRLFSREEFRPDGFHNTEDYLYRQPKTTLIVDSDVLVTSGENRGKSIALSKKQFARYVSEQVEPFAAPDLSGFRPFFERLRHIIEAHEFLHDVPKRGGEGSDISRVAVDTP
ncbi:UNVERIFIED_ORG: RNA-directed DNA polymerase [Burkholderia sp. CF145]